MHRPGVRVLSADAVIAMPWRNGGGSTTELAIEPANGSLANGFQWRLSIADVCGSGPFSTFPGYRRLIALAEGEGMTLAFDDGQRHHLDKALEPFGFDGARELEGELDAGPVRDFNLIYDPTRVRASLWPLRGDAMSGPAHLAADTILSVCLAGGMNVHLPALVQRHSLRPGACVRIDGAGDGLALAFEAMQQDTLGMVVMLTHVLVPLAKG